jgi:undecaprenyl-diphosphatase
MYLAMNLFDSSIIAFLNEPSHHFLIVDKIMKHIVDWQFVKGGLVFAVIWGLWFSYSGGSKQEQVRTQIVSTLVACICSLLLAQVLEAGVFSRTRPIFSSDLQFVPPLGWNPSHYSGANCFPSDHATMYFALATGIWFIHRVVGSILFLYVFLFICFPRIYLGLHYPTDILAGAFLGIGMTMMFSSSRIRCHVAKPFLRRMGTTPSLYYACFFLVTFEMGNLFLNVRGIAKGAYHMFIFYWH